jgi:hypothetical protein
LEESAKEVGLTGLTEPEEKDGAVSFLLSDPDSNWWEIKSPRQ